MNNILPIITLLIGAYATYFFTQKAKINESALKYKEEQYTKLLVKLQGFVGQTADAPTKKEFFKEQYKSWLYSSDEVIENINKLIAMYK